MTRRQRIEDLTALAIPGQPALSPDGTEVVYVLATADAAADANVTSLWLASADGSRAARPLTRGRADSAPAWSPDGSTIAFLRADGGPPQLWVLPRDGGEPRQVTSLPLGAGAPAWSPDGTAIAFGAPVDPRAAPGEDDAARARRANAPMVADRLDYQADGAGLTGPLRKHLHVLDLASGQVRQLTEGDWHASDPVWAPGSAMLAFSAATAADADLEPRAPVYVIDVPGAAGGTAEPRLVALAGGYGAPAAWAPDGGALLVVGMTGEDGLAGHARLLRVPLAAGAAAGFGRDHGSRPAAAPGTAPGHGRGGNPETAPEGTDAPSPPGGPARGGRERAVPGPGPEVVDLAGTLDRNVMPGGAGYPGGRPQFADGGDTALFCVRDRGCSHVYAVPSDGSAAPRPVVAGAGRVVSGLSVAPRGGRAGDAAQAGDAAGGRGIAVVVLATPTSYGELVAVDLAAGTETVLTAHGAPAGPQGAPACAGPGADRAAPRAAGPAGEAERAAGPAGQGAALYLRREREFAISDGTVVQGWLIRDPGASGPGPLLLDIHGGPHNAWNGAADPAHLYHQELAARGWTVLLVNPRGSDGYGEAFYTAAAGAWGVADARDFLEPVDALVAEGLADPARLAVTGYSYGGFMTCYLTSRDRRFAAAVAGGVVSDLASMAGTSDEGHALGAWELCAGPGGAAAAPAAGGAVTAGTRRVSAAAARGAFTAMSPLSRVGDVTAPTLILHGGADLRCPVGQAQQWFTALREQGVPARLVLYPGASHLFILDGAPSHRIDYNQRVVDWVEQHASETRRPGREPGPLSTDYWERRLAELAERHKVPGASLGIVRIGPGRPHGDARTEEVIEAAYGYANWPARIEATTGTLFQIGSMSKVWTATLAMQLVDEGKLDLDAPVADVLPELRLADPEVARTVTMRHLLTHTSGIDGDVFTDTGRGDDCVERYVAQLSGQRQNHPLGATWSYCNAGFVLAGRVIEKLTGLTWDEALRQKIYAPLRLEHTVTLAEEALLHRTAAGHVDVTGDPVLAPVWQLPRSLGPAGLICSTPADVLAFARMHLAGGLAPDGTRVLSAESARAMTGLEADLPDKHSLGDSWGIGWIRFGWDGRRLVGHDGNTIGQAAFLRVLADPGTPGAGLAVTLLTNGGHARDLYYDLYTEIFAELAGVAVPPAIEPPPAPVAADITPHLGRYERAGVLIEVLARTEQNDGPTLRTTVTGPLAALVPDPVDEYPMTPAGPGLWLVREPGTRTWAPVTFYALPAGERYLHFGARATPKVA